MAKSNFIQLLEMLETAERLKQKVIKAELKQNPFEIVKGPRFDTQVCIN